MSFNVHCNLIWFFSDLYKNWLDLNVIIAVGKRLLKPDCKNQSGTLCRETEHVAVVTSVKNDEMFTVSFFTCNRKKYFIFDENDHDEVGAKCTSKKLPPTEIKQKLDQVYYFKFNILI